MTERTFAQPDHAFKASFRPDSAEVAAARSRFAAWLDANPMAREATVELTVVFSELASNAVDAHDRTAGPVSAQAWREDSDVYLEVTNAAPAGTTTDRWDLGDPLRGGGRGLMIVRAYTDDVDVAARDHTVTVRCRRRLDDG